MVVFSFCELSCDTSSRRGCDRLPTEVEETGRQGDREGDRETGRETGRETVRQGDRETGGQTGRERLVWRRICRMARGKTHCDD